MFVRANPAPNPACCHGQERVPARVCVSESRVVYSWKYEEVVSSTPDWLCYAKAQRLARPRPRLPYEWHVGVIYKLDFKVLRLESRSEVG